MPPTLRLQAEHPGAVERAAEILRRGGLVAFPTETVYGLGANALSREAVARIFEAKGRPSWDPLIVHVAGKQDLASLVDLPETLAGRVSSLASAFWPGPLTLLLPRTPACPDAVTAGRSAVGVRIPNHPVAQALLRAVRLPVAAPSANRFGHVSPTTAQHVLDDLDGRIDAVLDGGPTSVGVESTVLDPAPTPMLVYRAGAVTIGDLIRHMGIAAELFRASPKAHGSEPASLPSPGVGMRHYAPEIPLLLTGGTPAALTREIAAAGARGEVVCVLLPTDWKLPPTAGVQLLPWARWDSLEELGAALFSALRSAETSGATLILCPLPDPAGFGEALRDRLLKAARPR